MPFLTSPQAQATERTYRYFVELASESLELDAYGNPVPENYKRIDVVVSEPTMAAINELIASTDWLQGYTMVSHWLPESDDCDCF